MRRSAFAAFLLLAACSKGDEASNGASPDQDPVPARSHTLQTPVPASFDWSFVAGGNIGILSFGDGDPGDGEALLTLSCAPLLGQVRFAWNGPQAITLASGDPTAEVEPETALPSGHPLLRAFASSGTLTITADGQQRTLAAKPSAGRIAVESFFASCGG